MPSHPWIQCALPWSTSLFLHRYQAQEEAGEREVPGRCLSEGRIPLSGGKPRSLTWLDVRENSGVRLRQWATRCCAGLCRIHAGPPIRHALMASCPMCLPNRWRGTRCRLRGLGAYHKNTALPLQINYGGMREQCQSGEEHEEWRLELQRGCDGAQCRTHGSSRFSESKVCVPSKPTRPHLIVVTASLLASPPRARGARFLPRPCCAALSSYPEGALLCLTVSVRA